MYYIKDYREGDKFSGVYLCKQKQILKSKAGKTYYSLMLQDKTGAVDGKIWDLTNAINNFEELDYISCEGFVTSYQGNLQINISRVRVADEGEFDPADYIPTTKKDRGQMLGEINQYVQSVTNPYLSKLLKMFFVEDQKFVKAFSENSAAKSVHHGFWGGLLEHTLSVTNMCQYYAEHYPVINRDLLIAAALFHDIGKIEEFTKFPKNDYSDEGQLLGHIYIGATKVDAAASSIPGFPEKLKTELIHCILAHHGKLEFGSPKVPALVEARALHMADNTDAKLQTMTEMFEKAGDNMGWLGFSRVLDSNVRQTSREE